MTIKELIKQLLKHHEDMEVYIVDKNTNDGQPIGLLSKVFYTRYKGENKEVLEIYY